MATKKTETIAVGPYTRRKPRQRRPPEDVHPSPTTAGPTDGVRVQSVNKEPRRTATEGVKIVSNNNPKQTTGKDAKGVTITKRPS